MPLSLATSPFSMRSSKNARSSCAFLQQRLEGVFQQPLRQRRVVGKIRESDLRLDHPEFGEVAAGVGVLGAERRPEGVDLGERQAIGLDVELADTVRKVSRAKKSLREIDLPPAACAAGWRGRASRRGTARLRLPRRMR